MHINLFSYGSPREPAGPQRDPHAQHPQEGKDREIHPFPGRELHAIHCQAAEPLVLLYDYGHKIEIKITNK